MKNFILIIFLNCGLIGFSQEPFGKRFSVTASQGFSFLDFISPNVIGHNRFSINCVFGKNFMVSADGNYSYAKFKKYITNNQQSSNWLEAPKVRDLTIGGSLYYFRNKEGGYAPTGRYFFVSASYGIANKGKYTTDTVGTTSNPITIYYHSLDKQLTQTCFIVSAGFGRNFIINKRIILGYSLDFGGIVLNSGFYYKRFDTRYIMRPSVKIGYTF